VATGATVAGGWFVEGRPDLLTGYGSAYSYNHYCSPYGPCPRDALPIVIAMIGATTPSIRPHAHRGAEVPVPPRSMHPATRWWRLSHSRFESIKAPKHTMPAKR